MLEPGDDGGLHERDREQDGAAAGERILLAEPHDDREVDGEEERDGVEHAAATDVHERAIGQREDEDADDESPSPRHQSQQRAAGEHEQGRRLDRGRERRRKLVRERHHGGDRQQHGRSDERRGSFHRAPLGSKGGTKPARPCRTAR